MLFVHNVLVPAAASALPEGYLRTLLVDLRPTCPFYKRSTSVQGVPVNNNARSRVSGGETRWSAKAWREGCELAYVVVALSRMQGCYNCGLGERCDSAY